MSEVLPWLALGSLLVLSGSFSASETAFFSLKPREAARAGPRVSRLLDTPRELLLTILLGNLLVNLLFFAAAPYVLEGSLLVTGFGALLAILLAGEIFPKTFALRAPILVARASALPLAVFFAAFAPARRIVAALLDLAARALGEAERTERTITPEALAEALEKSAEEGILAMGEADLLADIVELGDLRVREIMTPRVDMVALDLDDDEDAQAEKLREAQRRRLTWLPVVQGQVDNVVGCVEMRDLLLHPERPLRQLVMPVKLVPEVARVLTMLADLREERVAEAVVVDEWGGTAGVVRLEDVFEEIVGEMRVEEEPVAKPVIPLGEGRFRVSGGLSVRDWNDLLEDDVVPNAFETVGGFVTALLGRIPKPGDKVVLGGGLVCEVHEVRGRRVHTLDLYLEPEAARGVGEVA